MSKKSIRPRHDQFMKYLMKDLSFTKAFLDFLLPANFRRELNLSELKDAKSSFVDEQLSEHFADAVFEVPYRDAPAEKANLVILFEHKSYKDEQLPFQLLRYLSNGYIHQIMNAHYYDDFLPWKGQMGSPKNPIRIFGSTYPAPELCPGNELDLYQYR